MSPDVRTRRRPGRERLLAALDGVFYRDGVGAAVLDELLREAGVARGTLYKNFRTRDELVEAYLQARHDATMQALCRIVEDDSTLEAKIDAIFDYLADLVADHPFRGCAFVVAAAELPDESRPALRWARIHKRASFELFRRMFEMDAAAAPSMMAEQLSILYDGALITSAVRPDSDAVNAGRSMAKLVLIASG